MNLDQGQQRKVTEWIEQGLKVSEVQSKLASEFGVRMTYMDVRFLIDDLKLRPKDQETAVVAPPVAASPVPPEAQEPAGPLDETSEPANPGGKVSVTVDDIARPGAMISGKVKFSDGQTAEWHLDQFGRLGLVPPSKGYRPPEADVAEFQVQLQNQLARMGF